MTHAYIDQAGALQLMSVKPLPVVPPTWRRVSYQRPGVDTDLFEVTAIWPVAEGDDEVRWTITPRAEKAAIEFMRLRIRFEQQLEQRLNDWVRERGYDSITSACTYENDPVFGAEGQAALAGRSATYAAGYAILAEVMSGERPVPESMADIEADLPALTWS